MPKLIAPRQPSQHAAPPPSHHLAMVLIDQQIDRAAQAMAACDGLDPEDFAALERSGDAIDRAVYRRYLAIKRGNHAA